MFDLPVGMYSYNFEKCLSFVTNKRYAHLYLQCTTVCMPTCIYSAQQFISTVCMPTIPLISSLNLWPYNVYHAPDLNDCHFRSLTCSFIQSQYDEFSHPYSSASSAVILCNFNNGSVSFDELSENATKFCRKS